MPHQMIKLVTPRIFTHQERQIIDLLLKEEFPGSKQLKYQSEHAKVIEECTSCSSIAIAVDTFKYPPAQVVVRVPIEATGNDADGSTFHILLHVVNGYLDEMEIFREDLKPLIGQVNAENLEILNLFADQC